jgi:hypothetical protein
MTTSGLVSRWCRRGLLGANGREVCDWSYSRPMIIGRVRVLTALAATGSRLSTGPNGNHVAEEIEFKG